MNLSSHKPQRSHPVILRYGWLLGLSLFLLLLPLQSCFTGIESTPKITEADLPKNAARGQRPELAYLNDISGEAPAAWQKGKSWTVTDPRSERVFGVDLNGATITLADITKAPTITGVDQAIINFDSPKGRVSYRTDITPDSLLRRQNLAIPFAVENSMIEAVRSRLKGNTYYILTSLWNDDEGNSMRGLKYIPVEVVDVVAGKGVYPLTLLLSYSIPQPGLSLTPGLINDAEPDRRFFTLAMASPATEGGTTHAFADLFSLSDPRLHYPKIVDEAWNNIRSGRVSRGMTRDECRLALGTPAEINRRPGVSEMREVWTYAEGIRLVFADGLLISLYR